MKSYDDKDFSNLWTDTILVSGSRTRFSRTVETARDTVVASATQKRPKPKPAELFKAGTGLTRTRRLEDHHKIGVQRSVIGTTTKLTQKRVFDLSVQVPDLSFTGLDPGIINLDNRLLEAVKESRANLLVDLVEFRKTSSMFMQAATDIVKTFHRLRSGRWIGDFVKDLTHPRTRASKKLAKRWLELQYGWGPTMGSIQAYGEVLANRIRDGIPREVRLVEKYGTARVKTFNGGQSIATLSGRRKLIARYTVRDPSLKTTAELGITNPLLVAWELVPFSFVTDWFFDIGNYLNRIDALVGISDLTIIDSNFQRTLLTIDVSGQGLIKPAGYMSEKTEYTRSAPRTRVYNTYKGFSLPERGLRNKLLSGLSLLTVLSESTRRFK